MVPHYFVNNTFTVKNLEEFLGGKIAMRRAMRFTRVKPTGGGFLSEEDARKLIVAHRGDLHRVILGD